MSVIKIIRPVSRPFIDVKNTRTVWKQYCVHIFKVFRPVFSSVHRLHQGIPVRHSGSKVVVIRFPFGIIQDVAVIILLNPELFTRVGPA